MRRFSELAKLADPSAGGGFLLRWRGKQEGPHSAEAIDTLLETHQIGLLHEISHQGEWLTLRDFIGRAEVVLRQKTEAEEAARREQEESEREQKEQEARLAEQQRIAAEAEAEARRQRQPAIISPLAQPPARRSSGLRTAGILLLLGGLVVTAYFFFGFDPSVESGMGRVNNIGLMADRQNGILIGIGLAIVGTIMLVIGSRD
ncbi:MAG TPA: hypothetical protein VK742_15040 [Candidatus Sulfotelmatobacter sp.]|jgi:hypothetical protein|nr:hypothetical protein [Candidatus Sulfotelmatobacter sp.]